MKNLEKTINFLLGAVGLVLIAAGFILTFGGLNLMSINPAGRIGIKPGDLFESPVVSIIFILFPMILVKHTLGKNSGFLNFSKHTITIVVILAVVVGFFAEVGRTYNYFTHVDEDITKSYRDIDIIYKKQMETTTTIETIINNYMNYEGSTFENLAQTRLRYINAPTVDDKVSAANGFDQQLRSMIVVVESYPDLKSNENVIKLIDVIIDSQQELAGHKRSYNEKVKDFNTNVKSFPYILITKPLGIETRIYFDEESLQLE